MRGPAPPLPSATAPGRKLANRAVHGCGSRAGAGGPARRPGNGFGGRPRPRFSPALPLLPPGPAPPLSPWPPTSPPPLPAPSLSPHPHSLPPTHPPPTHPPWSPRRYGAGAGGRARWERRWREPCGQIHEKKKRARARMPTRPLTVDADAPTSSPLVGARARAPTPRPRPRLPPQWLVRVMAQPSGERARRLERLGRALCRPAPAGRC